MVGIIIVIIIIIVVVVEFKTYECFTLASEFFNSTLLGHEPWDVVYHYMHVWCDAFFLVSLTLASKGVE